MTRPSHFELTPCLQDSHPINFLFSVPSYTASSERFWINQSAGRHTDRPQPSLEHIFMLRRLCSGLHADVHFSPQIRIMPKLFLTLGLRYQWQTYISDGGTNLTL